MANGNKPALHLYAVERTDGKDSRWDEIGALWAHKDGNGYSLKLKHLPLCGQELVIRKKLPKKDAAAADAAQTEGGA